MKLSSLCVLFVPYCAAGISIVTPTGEKTFPPGKCVKQYGASPEDAAAMVNMSGEPVSVTLQFRELSTAFAGKILVVTQKVMPKKNINGYHTTIKLSQGGHTWYVNPQYGDGRHGPAGALVTPANETEPGVFDGYFCVSLNGKGMSVYGSIHHEEILTDLSPANAKKLFLDFIGPLSTPEHLYGWSSFDIIDATSGKCVICSQTCGTANLWALQYMRRVLNATFNTNSFELSSIEIPVDAYEEISLDDPAHQTESRKWFARWAELASEWSHRPVLGTAKYFFSSGSFNALFSGTFYTCDRNEGRCFKFRRAKPAKFLLPKKTYVELDTIVERRASLLKPFFPAVVAPSS